MAEIGVAAVAQGRVEDVSLAALYMCSPAASWITATRLTIDGGQTHGATGFVEAKNAVNAKSAREKEKFSGGVEKPKL